jgi:hypothetical protein
MYTNKVQYRISVCSWLAIISNFVVFGAGNGPLGGGMN